MTTADLHVYRYRCTTMTMIFYSHKDNHFFTFSWILDELTTWTCFDGRDDSGDHVEFQTTRKVLEDCFSTQI
jgi:hypothetical protein